MASINTTAAATPAYSRGQASARGEVATLFLLSEHIDIQIYTYIN